MYFLFGQMLPQQVCIALMWVFSRYELSVGTDFTPTSAYCLNVAVFRYVLLFGQIVPQQVRIALMWVF